jgi:branched-chain amino acid aminotransferase
MDGELVPWEEAKVHVLTYTMHYGLGAFEGIRSYETKKGAGAVFRLREHADRLVDSIRICNVNVPFDTHTVCRAVVETLRANKLTEGYARPLAYIGTGSMGLYGFTNPVHLCVSVWKWGAYLGDDGKRNGIRCCISSFPRIGGAGVLSKGKIPGHYVNSILAKEEAIRNGFDEGILTDSAGYVLEGSGENLFAVVDGELLTPPLESAILGGITRDSVLKFAQELGVRSREVLFGRDVLYLADEVFLSGTAAEVTPVREIDGRIIGNGKPGPVTHKIQDLYHQVVRGRSPKFESWLTPYQIDGTQP